jgi:hypothetical protein
MPPLLSALSESACKRFNRTSIPRPLRHQGGPNPLADLQDATCETPDLPLSAPGRGPRLTTAAALRIRTEADGPSPKPRRNRDKEHLRFISRQPCVVCGRQPCEAHHIRFAQPRALGRRVSDEYTVPLCRLHHRELHCIGNERSWWEQLNIDPVPIAVRFWQQTKGVAEASEQPKMDAQITDASVGLKHESGVPSVGDLLSVAATSDSGPSQ